MSHLYEHGLYKKLIRGLRKPRTSFLCRLYEQFAAYISRGLCNPRLIFPRINEPNVSGFRWWWKKSVIFDASLWILHRQISGKINVQLLTVSALPHGHPFRMSSRPGDTQYFLRSHWVRTIVRSGWHARVCCGFPKSLIEISTSQCFRWECWHDFQGA